jgi:hypothetical protein
MNEQQESQIHRIARGRKKKLSNPVYSQTKSDYNHEKKVVNNYQYTSRPLPLTTGHHDRLLWWGERGQN